MTKFKKTFATALAFALVIGANTCAHADEEVKNPSLFEILTSDTDNTQSKENKKEIEDKEDFEKDPAYQEEFKARFDLYNKVLIAKELEEVDETGYIDILNKKAASKEDLEKALADLSEKIEDSDEKIALDLDIEGVKADVKDYILTGKLFFLDKLDKKDIKNLYLFYEATVNSYNFKNANEDAKKALTPTLQEIYDYILEVDKKVKANAQITEDDKEKTAELIEKLSKDLEENAKENANHQSMSIEKTSFLTGGNEIDGTLNEDSAFYKSDKPEIKEAYQKLSASQRTYIDQINADNNDSISEEEIKAAGDYNLPLEGAGEFIKPFLKSPDGNNVEVSSTEVAGTSTQTTSQPAQTPTTPQNPSGGVPETVTLSQGENTQGTKQSADTDTLLTRPASQVKTGIKGIGYLAIILVAAIIAFVVLGKKKKEEDNK